VEGGGVGFNVAYLGIALARKTECDNGLFRELKHENPSWAEYVVGPESLDAACNTGINETFAATLPTAYWHNLPLTN
jgi:hypothetical protein